MWKLFNISLLSIFLSLVLIQDNLKANDPLVGIYFEWDANTMNSHPDQIRVDPFDKNIVWYTQPRIAGIARFNFKTKMMDEFSTNGNYKPDGLVIDNKGILWFGEQEAGTIGRFDPSTKEFTHFKVPYRYANPAIPTVDNEGQIWLSDHVNNRIINFDPLTKKFTIYKAPSKDSWVVDLKADSKNRIWYTCYESNRIGMIDKKRKLITEYSLPNNDSGPSFLVLDSKEKLWMTYWKRNCIGKFDPETKIFEEYALPLTRPGPAAIAIDKEDRIFFSTKDLNSVVMFDPRKPNSLFSFPIPTEDSGQKDGITVDNDGNIWITEFDANKIARLTIVPKSEANDLPGRSAKNRTVQPVKIYNSFIIKKSATQKTVFKVELYKE